VANISVYLLICWDNNLSRNILSDEVKSCPVNYLQCKDVPPERLYQGCDILINVNYQDIILNTAKKYMIDKCVILSVDVVGYVVSVKMLITIYYLRKFWEY
jgi:hypothetical protein